MSMDTTTWLESLKVGDEVVVESPTPGGTRRYVAVVSKMTAQQIVIGLSRFRRRDGRQIGGDPFWKAELLEATPGVVASIREAKRRRVLLRTINLSSREWEDLSTEALEEIASIISRGRGGKDG